jgi:hypothetical protein
MHALTIDTIYDPVFLTGLVASAVLLGGLRQNELTAEKEAKDPRHRPISGVPRTSRPLRVRIGGTPY